MQRKGKCSRRVTFVNLEKTLQPLLVDGCAPLILLLIWKKKNSDTTKLRKKFRAPRENRTHAPTSSSSDALTTELVEALWRAGSEFNCNYTSHRGLHRGLTRWYQKAKINSLQQRVSQPFHFNYYDGTQATRWQTIGIG